MAKEIKMEEVLKRLEAAELAAIRADKRAADAEAVAGKLQAVALKTRLKLKPRVPEGTSGWKKIEGENHEIKQGKVSKLDKDKVLVGYREEAQYNADGSYNPDIFVRLAPVKK